MVQLIIIISTPNPAEEFLFLFPFINLSKPAENHYTNKEIFVVSIEPLVEDVFLPFMMEQLLQQIHYNF